MSTKEADMSLESLPREILTKILGYLTFKELNTFILVSKACKSSGEDHILWKMYSLVITKDNIELLPEILNITRLAKITTVEISYRVMNITDSIVSEILCRKNPKIEKLDILKNKTILPSMCNIHKH